MGLHLRIERKPHLPHSKPRVAPARVFLRTGIVRPLGWTVGMDLAVVFESSPDLLRVIPEDPEWQPSPIKIQDAPIPIRNHPELPLTYEQHLRMRAKDFFQSEPSGLMIRNKMEDLRKEDKSKDALPVISDVIDPVMEDLPFAKEEDVASTKTAPIKRNHVNNLPDKIRWGYG